MKYEMKRALCVLALLFGALGGMMTPAHAGQIEAPDAKMWGPARQLVYAEPIPSKRYPYRHYFEVNDGSTYIYLTYERCRRDNLVPNRVCRSVFWYAK